MLPLRRALTTAVSTALLFGNLALSQPPPTARPPAPPPPLPLNGPTIKLEQGEVQGALNEGVAVFRGLPFAAPPIGDLRWRAPQPAAKWQGVRPANVFGGNCRES